eukprot:CCRYP_017818-RB/>CCRYP_017818-RB protein AED:0.41 eAED:0.41 QI:0/0/0/1/0/0/2/0/209
MPYIHLMEDAEAFIEDTRSLRENDSLVMVQTVCGNFKGYTRKDMDTARMACEVQAMMAHPLDETLKHLVSSTNAMRNIDISVPAIANAKKLLGPNLGGVRGKTVRQRPSAMRPESITIPWDLYKWYKNVTLTANVMFVNGLPFLVTLLQDIKLGSVELLPSHTAKHLVLRDKMSLVMINTTVAREDVGDIKRYISVIKERARNMPSQLP